MRSGKNVAYLLVMKSGAKPKNDAWYIQQVVNNLIPEALSSTGIQIAARWQVGTIDQTGAIMHAMSEFGDDVSNTTKYELITQSFSDADGDGGTLLAAYYK